MIVPNLVIIAGTGSKSGKTSAACRIIEQFRDAGIAAVKITPHQHETTRGLTEVDRKPGYDIFLETNPETDKDTSRMLRAGASRVYFVRAADEYLAEAFGMILESVPAATPLVCESAALRYFIEPGLFVIMTSAVSHRTKDIRSLQRLPHVEFELESLPADVELPLSFHNGRWICWHYGR